MKKTRVISYKNLPARLPIGPTLLCWLSLDRIKAPGWVWGMVGAILAIWWIGAAVQIATEKSVDLFEERKQ